MVDHQRVMGYRSSSNACIKVSNNGGDTWSGVSEAFTIAKYASSSCRLFARGVDSIRISHTSTLDYSARRWIIEACIVIINIIQNLSD